MNVKRNANHLRAATIFALLVAVSPAWGQRIRFAQPTLDDAAEGQEEVQVAAQPERKAKPAAKADVRPAPPRTVVAPLEEELIAPRPMALARRVPVIEEPIDTPPPFFVEPEAGYPIYEYEPYGMEYEPGFAPWRPSLGSMFSPQCCWPTGFSAFRGAGVFGEYLYLRPRDTEIAFAVPGQGPVIQGGNPTVPVPQGRTVLLDPDYSSGYRAGLILPLQPCSSSVQIVYTTFDADTQNGRTLTADEINQNVVLFPLLLHPRTFLPNNATNVEAHGQLGVELEAIDADARLVLWDSKAFTLNGFAGARWASLDQDLLVNYSINGGTVISAASGFEGVGPRAGLDGYGAIGRWGFGYFGRSEINFLYGSTKGSFNQFQANNPDNPQVFTDWKADRIAPVYEMEVGFQWMGPKKHLRLSVGYLMSVWFNVVRVEDVTQGLHQSEFDDLSDTMTFDGVTARAEFRL